MRRKLPQCAESAFAAGTPLETIPLGAITGAAEPSSDEEVGYGKPPKSSRWRKGDPSPNPYGRPRKSSQSVFTQLMEDVIIHPEQGTITKRQLLDLITLSLAIEKGGRWLDEWENRQARDRLLLERVKAFEELPDAEKRRWEAAAVRKADTWLQNVLRDAVDQHFPGVQDTIRQLEELGVLEYRDGKLVKAAWLSEHDTES